MPDLHQLLVATSRTFALNIPRLPPPLDRQVTVAYLLYRIADTFEDATRWPPERRRRALAELRRLLTEPAAGVVPASWLERPPTDHDGYRALLAATPEVLRELAEMEPRAAAIVHRYLAATIDGMSEMLGRAGGAERPLRDLAELRRYCWIVAGSVGEMLTELFVVAVEGLDDTVISRLRRRAAAFGEGLQLVNILKDAGLDAEQGRRFLPRGVSRSEIFWRARRDLAVAGEYVELLRGAGAPPGLVLFCALPAALALPTLDRVERRGAGAKLTRPEVAAIVETVEIAVAAGRPLPFAVLQPSREEPVEGR